jgi:CheY-like chemotaxis protein
MRPTDGDSALKVLVIEDDDDSRETLRLVLEAAGHEVEDAEDGRSGLQKLLELRPELTLIDVGLPDLDGYDVVREARRRAEGQGLYLVALTGYSQPEDRRHAADVGFDAVLAKPIDWQALDQVVATARAARRLS